MGKITPTFADQQGNGAMLPPNVVAQHEPLTGQTWHPPGATPYIPVLTPAAEPTPRRETYPSSRQHKGAGLRPAPFRLGSRKG